MIPLFVQISKTRNPHKFRGGEETMLLECLTILRGWRLKCWTLHATTLNSPALKTSEIDTEIDIETVYYHN